MAPQAAKYASKMLLLMSHARGSSEGCPCVTHMQQGKRNANPVQYIKASSPVSQITGDRDLGLMIYGLTGFPDHFRSRIYGLTGSQITLDLGFMI